MIGLSPSGRCQHGPRIVALDAGAAPNAAPTGCPKTAPSRGARFITAATADVAYQNPGAADQECALAMYQKGSSLSAVAHISGVSVQAVNQRVIKGPPPGPGCGGGAQSALRA